MANYKLPFYAYFWSLIASSGKDQRCTIYRRMVYMPHTTRDSSPCRQQQKTQGVQFPRTESTRQCLLNIFDMFYLSQVYDGITELE